MGRYNDEELLYLSRQGCLIAYQALIEEYYQLIQIILRKMRIHQTKYVDENDVIQLAIINCIQAFDSYRPDRNAKLKTFMSWVIRHSIISTMKKATNDHNRYYAFSLDASPTYATNMSYEEVIADKKEDYQPREVLFVKETKAEYEGYVKDNCSLLEKDVMGYRLEGYSNQDIAKVLQVDIKSIYNAVYRLQKKLRYLK